MGYTISEKILAEHAGLKHVEPGEIVKAKIDLAMAPDLTAVLAYNAMKEMGVSKVWDPSKVIFLLDHIAPSTNIQNATLHKQCREIAYNEKMKYFYDINAGVCHQVLPEKGHVYPGMLLVGADSHTCTHGAFGAFATGIGSTDMGAVLATGKLWFKVPETIKIEAVGNLQDRVYPKDLILKIAKEIGADGATYSSIEFTGESIKNMSISGRMTLCNMAIEMGGKTGIVETDEITLEYLRNRIIQKPNIFKSDSDAMYSKILKINSDKIVPQVSCPHSVDNVRDITELKSININQIFIGSCTNGRLDDLEVTAEILKNKIISDKVRLHVTPASMGVYKKALEKGLIKILIDAGAVICNPSCGACFGGNNGILAPGEVGLSTSNRNFKGRQGSPEAQVYLCSPATAAASALTGVITDPRVI
ncbi:3-isopropylmalate dehydratase large subunit [Candidatus Bathyarchaeota archaeon]|nr:3-isopropylmalate dehydratase large subunit [Candidatus Bathyarchaeota archaeon]